MNNATPRYLRENINTFGEQLLRVHLARDSNLTGVRTVGRREAEVTWLAPGGFSIALGGRTSWKDYLRFLEARQYTILLADYSLLQLSYIVRRDEVVRHRLVYYPCPLSIEDEEVESLGGVVDVIGALAEGELLDRLRQDGPLRFDYDPIAAATAHSASHLHLSGEVGRVAVNAPLSPGRFIRFVFSHFYRDAWEEFDFLRDWPCFPVAPCISREDQGELHLTCLEPMDKEAVQARRRRGRS